MHDDYIEREKALIQREQESLATLLKATAMMEQSVRILRRSLWLSALAGVIFGLWALRALYELYRLFVGYG